MVADFAFIQWIPEIPASVFTSDLSGLKEVLFIDGVDIDINSIFLAWFQTADIVRSSHFHLFFFIVHIYLSNICRVLEHLGIGHRLGYEKLLK